MSGTVHLDPESVEAVAARVAQLLQAGSIRIEDVAAETLTTTETAERFNVSPDYLREHADDLQAGRMGDGPKARLRFNPAIVAAHLAPRPDPRTRPDPPAPARRRPTAVSGDLLPVKGVDQP
jgi:hypothetical protein